MQLIKAKALDYRRFTQYRIAILFHCGGLILILWGVRHDCSSAYPYERRKAPLFFGAVVRRGHGADFGVERSFDPPRLSSRLPKRHTTKLRCRRP